MDKKLGVYAVGEEIVLTGGMYGYIQDPYARFDDYNVVEVVVDVVIEDSYETRRKKN